MSTPTTPMEGGGTWATVAEGEAFLDDLATSGRVTYATIGTASNGQTIRSVTVSTDGTASLSDAQAMIVASQHGNEPVGREAAFRVMRDYAFDTAPSVPVAFIPTPNPWGVDNNDRENIDGTDINRTHVSLSSPEGLAVQQAVRSASPRLVIDNHQWGAASSDLSLRMHGRVVGPAYRSWAVGFMAAVAQGVDPVTVGEYPLTEHEGMLHNALAIQGVPSVLLESNYNEPDLDEIAWQIHFMTWAVDYVAANGTLLDTVKAESQAWLRAEGYVAHAPLPFYENGWVQPPLGYVIEAGDIDPQILATHGIRAHPRRNYDTSLYVPMDQPAMAHIAWLLDPRAPRPLTLNAVPVWRDSEAAVDLNVSPYELPGDIKVAGARARRIVTDSGMSWGS